MGNDFTHRDILGKKLCAVCTSSVDCMTWWVGSSLLWICNKCAGEMGLEKYKRNLPGEDNLLVVAYETKSNAMKKVWKTRPKRFGFLKKVV